MSKLDKLRSLTDNDIGEFSLAGRKTVGKVVDIYDADTCKIIFGLDNVIVKFNCRLSGIDTPELKPPRSQLNRDLEKKAAQKARNRLIQLCTDCECQLSTRFSRKSKKELLSNNEKLVNIHCGDFDKYGRLLVKIFDINGNKSYNDMLIAESYANKYDGGKKEPFKFNTILDIESDTESENSDTTQVNNTDQGNDTNDN